MNDFITNSQFNLVSIVALFISALTFVVSTVYLIKRNSNFQSLSLSTAFVNDFNLNFFNETLIEKEKEISDLRKQLILKQSIENDILKTINSSKDKGKLDSFELVNDLKSKLINFNHSLPSNKFKILDDKGIFKVKLEHLHPSLNYQDRLLCSYFRLHLSLKEIAKLEGITYGTVRVYKHKIKQKIGLSHEESLTEYLCRIEVNKEVA